MTEKGRKLMPWVALACLVVPMFGSYFFDDMFSSISHLFSDPSLTQLGWDAAGYGLYTSGYSVLCVFGGEDKLKENKALFGKVIPAL